MAPVLLRSARKKADGDATDASAASTSEAHSASRFGCALRSQGKHGAPSLPFFCVRVPRLRAQPERPGR